MMTKGSRILVLVAALALGLIYVLPVWRIDLEAPQYPEGLGMVIQVNTIEGKKPNDLDNINNLNHYIGMKRIVPESIPELRVMPVVIGVLILLGVLAAALGRRWLLYVWVGAFLLVAVGGLADFWKWAYDYGHNLDDENAIIKVPGMTYQPPLIGSKQLLNFRAHSWPGAGGWIAIASCLVGVGVVVSERRRGKAQATNGRGDAGEPAHEKPDASRAVTPLAVVGPAAVLTMAVGGGCAAPEPRPVELGVDVCDHCLMVVEDDGHAAEIVTDKGLVYVFDSVECMAAYLRHGMGEEEAHSLWVSDFSNPGELIPAEDALYLRSETLPSPMGLGLTAFARQEDRDGAVNSFGGRALDWTAVQEVVAEAWPDGRPPRGHGGHQSAMGPRASAGPPAHGGR